MDWFARVVAIVFLALTCVAPFTPHAACDDGHDAAPPDTCLCTCHGAATVTSPASDMAIDHPVTVCVPWERDVANRLPDDDIYRPPICR